MKESAIRSVNPATNTVEKVFEAMSRAEIDKKLAVADATYREWKKKTFTERAAVLHRVAALFRERKEEMARLCAIEMGKLLREGVAEVLVCADILDYYADASESFLADMPLERPTGRAFVSFEPLGVILSIQPWNFPYSQPIRNVAPIVMAGNTVAVKHASNVPQCAAMLERLFREAGAPEGLYTNLYVPGAEASQLAADKRIRAVTLTGSEPAGSSLAAVAGKHIKKSVLELGGIDAFIVLDDADMDKAVNAAALGRLRNAGQACTCPKRIIVMESMAAEFTQKVKAIYEALTIGDPLDEATQLAPLSSEKQLETVLRQVEANVAAGAVLVYGGKRLAREGAFMSPAILTGIKPGMVAYSEEIFGPVLSIFTVKDEEEAVRLANDSDFGLGGSVFSTNEKRAISVARRIETGMVAINGVVNSTAQLPFGGIKQSGYGRELSPLGILEFVNAKLIRIDS